MVKIKQGVLSKSVSSFDFLGKYNLGPYENRNAPAIFFGCYAHTPQMKDFIRIMKHRGLAIVVWCGSDAWLIPKQRLRQMKFRQNIKHVAIGQYIEDDLIKAGVRYVRLSLTPNTLTPKPCPLGDSIYVYLPNANRFQRDFYGGTYIDQLRRLMPREKFIITKPHQYTKEQVEAIYKRCYIGLRLTRHDGLPNTVTEMGAMGRMCIYNDRKVPNAIGWRNIYDVQQRVQEEKKFIGQTKVDIANAVCNFLKVPNDWLHTQFWK